MHNRDESKGLIGVLGRDHPYSKSVIEEEQMKVDSWNRYSKGINDANKRMGGTKDISKLKKNRYLGE